jgi:hypothetical protein
MRTKRRDARCDLLVLCLAMFALAPLSRTEHPDLTCNIDGKFHVITAAETEAGQ